MTCVREADGGHWMHYNVMKQHGEPWSKLKGEGMAGSKRLTTMVPELIHMINVSRDHPQGHQEHPEALL